MFKQKNPPVGQTTSGLETKLSNQLADTNYTSLISSRQALLGAIDSFLTLFDQLLEHATTDAEWSLYFQIWRSLHMLKIGGHND